MTQDEFEMLRLCRSAELAYFMSEHTLEKPKFIQNWFKNKVKTERAELSDQQVQMICSEWQVKQKTFYKKYRAFTDHFDKVIQNLQGLADQNDRQRLDDLLKQLDVLKVSVENGLNPENDVNVNVLPAMNHAGLVFIDPAEQASINDDGNVADTLSISLRTLDAKRFYFLLDLFRIYGFDCQSRDKYVAGELVSLKLSSSAGNDWNRKVEGYEHSREKDWREELVKSSAGA